MLPPSEPGNGGHLLHVRPADLPGLHGLRGGRDQVSGMRGPRDRREEDGSADRQRRRPGHRRDHHEGLDRSQRGDLPRPDRPGQRRPRHRRPPLRQRGSLRAAGRRRRVVAARHLRVPAREPDPPSLQHAHALVVRRTARDAPRPGPLPRDLLRIDPGRVGRRAPPGARQGGRRSVRSRLRDPRRRTRSSSGTAFRSSAGARSSSSASTSC